MKCKTCEGELTKKQTAFCSIECKGRFQTSRPKEVFDETKQYKCKIDSKIFSSGAARSGTLKKYSTDVLQKEFDWNDWEIIDKPSNAAEYWNCPHCDWKGKAKNGLDGGGWIGNHLLNIHNINKDVHVQQFPSDNILWPHSLKKIERVNKINESEDNRIQCLECNEWFKKISNTHLKLHKLTEFEYKAKHGHASLSSVSFCKRMSDLYYQNDKMQSKLSRSKYEDELCDLFTSLKVNVLPNHKKFGFDIDVLLPDNNLAIEFNGLYWHSEYAGGKTDHYHLNKTKSCEKLGIHLIHIFEDEWVHKREIVISRLKNLLGKTENVVYARKCEIREVPYQDAANFLNENHIQGSITTIKARVGLFYETELVSLMTFGLPRNSTGNKIKKVGQWELQRYCNKLNYSVVGGASRLLKYFQETYKPENLYSFADRRWTSTLKDSLYDELGFVLVSKGEPNYWYLVENMKRHHRFNFTKQSILKKFAKSNPDISEWENMIELGFDRIWDCGSLKYEKLFTNDSVEIDLNEPVERIGKKPVQRKRKRKETDRNIADVVCKICENSYSIVGIASHFKLNHGLTVDEYVISHEEYRPQKLKELALLELANGEYDCEICNFGCRNEKHLSSHISKIHKISKQQYVIENVLQGDIPKCKCGCGQNVVILTAKPYFREFVSGHNSSGELNGMFGKKHKKESKEKMSGPRTWIKK